MHHMSKSRNETGHDIILSIMMDTCPIMIEISGIVIQLTINRSYVNVTSLLYSIPAYQHQEIKYCKSKVENIYVHDQSAIFDSITNMQIHV